MSQSDPLSSPENNMEGNHTVDGWNHVENPVNNGTFTLSTGVGFQPSTVVNHRTNGFLGPHSEILPKLNYHSNFVHHPRNLFALIKSQSYNGNKRKSMITSYCWSKSNFNVENRLVIPLVASGLLYHFGKVHRTAARKKCELTVGQSICSPSPSAFSHTARETNCNSQGSSRRWNLLIFWAKIVLDLNVNWSINAMGQTSWKGNRDSHVPPKHSFLWVITHILGA